MIGDHYVCVCVYKSVEVKFIGYTQFILIIFCLFWAEWRKYLVKVFNTLYWLIHDQPNEAWQSLSIF